MYISVSGKNLSLPVYSSSYRARICWYSRSSSFILCKRGFWGCCRGGAWGPPPTGPPPKLLFIPGGPGCWGLGVMPKPPPIPGLPRFRDMRPVVKEGAFLNTGWVAIQYSSSQPHRCSEASSRVFSCKITSHISKGHWASFSADTSWTFMCLVWDLPRDFISLKSKNWFIFLSHIIFFKTTLNITPIYLIDFC